MRIEQLSGLARVEATSRVLQRARRRDPLGGVWEAADVQWWWRRPRPSDLLALPVWFDAEGPCGAVSLVDWGDSWQGDLFVVPDAVTVEEVGDAMLRLVAQHRLSTVDVAVRDDDEAVNRLLAAAGFTEVGEPSPLSWMSIADRPSAAPLTDGLVLVDRASHADGPHPMVTRNGPDVDARLREVSLYDPALDLRIETDAGRGVAYALFWMDPTTKVGMLEPMRVEEGYERRGLARALLTKGLELLATRGAETIKVTFGRYAGRDVHASGAINTVATVRMMRRESA